MTPRKQYDTATLLYRRQFVLGPSFVKAFPSWTRLVVRDTIRITAHPDLHTYHAARENKSITLLGYLLDAESPELDDAAICTRLLDRLFTVGSFEDVLEGTGALGGRWILIVDDGTTIRLFTDPMGLRQVHYTNTDFRGRHVWCATQPGLLAETLHLQPDQDAAQEYTDTPTFQNCPQRLWPGDSTAYREVSHLLPNHYLDLTTRVPHRFWPNHDLAPTSLEDAVQTGSTMLAGLIRSAASRFELAMTFSAGWDSRVLLAASKDICHHMVFYTYDNGSPGPDVAVAPQLLKKLGLKDTVVRYASRMDRAFDAIYTRNVATAHHDWGRAYQGLFRKYAPNRVCITGGGAEITRVRFRLPPGEPLSARGLARFTYCEYDACAAHLECNPYVLKAWERWIGGLGNVWNVHPMDLFYWEHYAGNFAAMDQNEGDIVHDTLTPYNCRKYLMAMLAVDEQYRDHDEPIHYRMMIRNLWPAVLSEPVNPPRTEGLVSANLARLRRKGAAVLAETFRTRLYDVVKRTARREHDKADAAPVKVTRHSWG